MARVAVLHNTLDFHGGADAVALATCDALAADHAVDLFTVSETDPAALAPTFGLKFDGDVGVRSVPAADRLAAFLGRLTPHVGTQLAARSALVALFFRRYATEYDAAVSTTNELSLPVPSVQYVHFPQFHLDRLPARYGVDPGRLNPLWSRLAGPDPGRVDPDATLVANSAWTADAVAAVYGRRPSVVHPPVEPIEERRDWEAREDGVVVVGRLAPDRRVLDAFEVVDRVRDRGHDLHLHVVGTAPRAYRPYVERVRREAGKRPYVSVETDVPRARLEELLGTHRYGLNVRPDESFGIAVAEYVAAGMIAVAPDAGGQRQVLGDRSDRLFGSLDEAVDRLADAVASDARPELPVDRFDRDRFASAMRGLVAERIEAG